MAFKLRNTITAILFLALLLTGICYLASGANQARFSPGEGFFPAEKSPSSSRFHAKQSVGRPGRGTPLTPELLATHAETTIAGVEKSLTDTLDRDHLFIETYGRLQALQGRRVMEDVEIQYTVARLSDGTLTFANPNDKYSNPEAHGLAVSAFRDALSDTLDIPLLYVQAPQKVSINHDATLPAGLEDFGDAHANMLARTLRSEGVNYLDLRPVLLDTHRYAELFFSTDHHWTPEGAFLGWQAVAEVLTEEFELELVPDSYDRDAFDTVTYEDVFLGSQGKRVGATYAGVDDLTVWYPKEFTWLRYQVPTQNYDRKGRFQQSVLFPERLEEGDLYESNPYTYYSGGDYSFARMKNLLNPDGPKVVLLRDSFACPFAPFMALGCGEVITIDLRYFQDDLMSYIQWVEADMVVMLYSPGSIRLDPMFDFFYRPGDTRPPNRKPMELVLDIEKPTLSPGSGTPSPMVPQHPMVSPPPSPFTTFRPPSFLGEEALHD